MHAASRQAAGKLVGLLRQPFRREDWLPLIGEDCHLRIANDPPVIGRDAVVETLERFFGRSGGFSGFLETWQRGEALFAETEIALAGDRPSPLRIPCTVILRLRHGAVRDLRLHLDPTPLL